MNPPEASRARHSELENIYWNFFPSSQRCSSPASLLRPARWPGGRRSFSEEMLHHGGWCWSRVWTYVTYVAADDITHHSPEETFIFEPVRTEIIQVTPKNPESSAPWGADPSASGPGSCEGEMDGGTDGEGGTCLLWPCCVTKTGWQMVVKAEGARCYTLHTHAHKRDHVLQNEAEKPGSPPQAGTESLFLQQATLIL